MNSGSSIVPFNAESTDQIRVNRRSSTLNSGSSIVPFNAESTEGLPTNHSRESAVSLRRRVASGSSLARLRVVPGTVRTHGENRRQAPPIPSSLVVDSASNASSTPVPHRQCHQRSTRAGRNSAHVHSRQEAVVVPSPPAVVTSTAITQPFTPSTTRPFAVSQGHQGMVGLRNPPVLPTTTSLADAIAAAIESLERFNASSLAPPFPSHDVPNRIDFRTTAAANTSSVSVGTIVANGTMARRFANPSREDNEVIGHPSSIVIPIRDVVFHVGTRAISATANRRNLFRTRRRRRRVANEVTATSLLHYIAALPTTTFEDSEVGVSNSLVFSVDYEASSIAIPTTPRSFTFGSDNKVPSYPTLLRRVNDATTSISTPPCVDDEATPLVFTGDSSSFPNETSDPTAIGNADIYTAST